MDAWSCERRAFALRSGAEIRITLLDVALILGLPVSGNPVSFTAEEPFSDLEELFGATIGKRKVALSFLENKLDSIGDAVSDDFVRSFLLYTIGTFLSSNDGKVDSRFLRFFEDLEEVAGFAWGGVFVDDLCQWLDKRKENNVQYVGGCLIFLQTWSYEHFDVAARPQLQDHDLTFPRVCRWDNNKSIQRQRGTSWFKDLDDDQVIWKLQPTTGELQIEIIKEALELLGDNKELHSAESCSTSTPSSVSDVDSGLRLSINNGVHKVDEADLENQVVEDTPTRSSTCDEEYRKQINLENLIVLDTPPNLTIHDKERREQEMNLENLAAVVEDTPTNSVADDVGGDQEFNGEKLIVEDTPPQSSFNYQGDLRKENGMLEEITELKMTLGQVMEENELLRGQVLSMTQLEKHNAELKKELDLLREENRNLKMSIRSFGDRLEQHILDFESNATE